jgi:hypothetical protein
MSTVRERTGVLRRIGLPLAVIGLVSLSCGGNHEPVTEEEKETWDATAFFLAGIFTISRSLEEDVLLRENFSDNYEWLRDVFLPHLRGTPKHPWTSCPEYCIAAAKKLAEGDEEKEEQIGSALAEARERPTSE